MSLISCREGEDRTGQDRTGTNYEKQIIQTKVERKVGNNNDRLQEGGKTGRKAAFSLLL